MAIIDSFQTLTMIRFYFTMNQDVTMDKLLNPRPRELDKLCEDIEIQLTARCGGLLETSHQKYGANAKIKWFHRTVRDFIEQNPYGCDMLENSLKTNFNPDIWMMRSTMFELFAKTMKHPKAQKETIDRLVKTCLIYAQDADTVAEFHDAQVNILDKVDNFMTTNWDSGPHLVAPFIPTIRLASLPALEITFLHVATFYNLTGYVEAKVPEEIPQR